LNKIDDQRKEAENKIVLANNNLEKRILAVPPNETK
jgi:hypothetical protein